jgi:hypothetical protein
MLSLKENQIFSKERFRLIRRANQFTFLKFKIKSFDQKITIDKSGDGGEADIFIR